MIRLLPITLLIIIFSLLSLSAALSILPEYEKRPDGIVKLRDARRNLELSEPVARQVADIMMSKNFSLLIDFTVEEQTRGTLFSVYAGSHKVFELYAEGLRGELRIHWRRHSSLANLHIKHLLDDNRWHTILLSMQRSRLRLLIDCEEAVAGDYPEIDFSLLNSTKPQIWIGQRNKAQSFFQGAFRRFDLESTNNLVRRNCGGRSMIQATSSQYPRDQPTAPAVTQATVSVPVQPSPQIVLATSRDSPTLEELKSKVNSLETVFNRILNNVFSSSPTILAPAQQSEEANQNTSGTTTDPADAALDFSTPLAPSTITDGVCPNCYEYLRYKINHLEDELKNWRERVKKMDKNFQRIMLAQRGCQLNSTTVVNEGFTWTNNCTECVCSLGKAVCKPIGCSPLPSTCAGQRPHLRPGQCCPTVECPKSCAHLGQTYEHGKVFWPKECVRCQCIDGNTSCAYRTNECPRLNCPIERQYKHENHCCPVCEHDDFCTSHPCHANATCVNRKADRECNCKPGFFGDGEQCFDVDECRWDPSVAEQLGGCGTGSRCINTPGSFYCECLPGYAKLNDRACLDMIIL